MKTCLILLLCAVLSNQSHSGSILPDRSLSGDWNINITMILENFVGRLFYCSDSNNNTIMLYTSRRVSTNSNVISLSYNMKHTFVSLQSICNCDPCHSTMMTFEVSATAKSVKMKCNGFQETQVPRIDNRGSNISSLGSVGELFLLIASNKEGCLKSLLFNMMKINFEKFECLFTEKCPRDCDQHTCNDGKCLAYRNNGNLCDCSNTARNGPFCDYDIRRYDSASINSFMKRNTVYGFEIKLSWETTMTQRFCLIELVSKYHHVTLIVHEFRLLAGTKFVTMVNKRKMNFLTLSFEESGTTLKVNNEMVDHRLDLFGEITVHIGMTRKNATCDTFTGNYDIQSDYSHLLPVPKDKYEVMVFGRTETDLKLPIIYSIISFFALLTVVCIMVTILYCIRFNRKVIRTIYAANRYRGTKTDFGEEFKDNEENYENPNFMSMSYRPISNISDRTPKINEPV